MGKLPDPSDRRTDWEQATEKLREAIACGALIPGDALPSVPELARLQGLKPGTVRHAFPLLAAVGCWLSAMAGLRRSRGTRPGSATAARYRSARSRSGHDCKLSGCRPHACKPMSKSTIHSILSGAFEAAQRWEWADYNPAESAKPPTVTQKKRQARAGGRVVVGSSSI